MNLPSAQTTTVRLGSACLHSTLARLLLPGHCCCRVQAHTITVSGPRLGLEPGRVLRPVSALEWRAALRRAAGGPRPAPGHSDTLCRPWSPPPPTLHPSPPPANITVWSGRVDRYREVQYRASVSAAHLLMQSYSRLSTLIGCENT